MNSFEETYRESFTDLCRYAERFVGSHAEDVVHDAFVATDFSRVQTSPRRYLFRTVRHKALNLLARHETARRVDLEELPGGNLEEQILREEEVQRIRNAIECLAPRRKKVVQLHFFQELSIAEVAERLEVNRRTVHRDMALALESIHRKLRER